MKALGIIILIFNSVQLFGQESNTTSFLNKMDSYDFSDLWTLSEFYTENGTEKIIRQEPLGFIGDHYQRFYIQFISVIQDPKNRKAYFVYGKTKVKANICSFQGTFIIIDAKYYNHGDDPKVKQGFIVGSYELYEDSDKSSTGILKGTFKTEFYIDAKGKPQYDAISFVADGYCNNQFEGTWTSYRNGETKKCNWGDYRIPGSKDLDVGTGEFAPSESYREYGWQDYFLSVISSPNSPEAQEAKRREKEQWWRE